MKYVYKLICVYLFFAFTLGTLTEFEAGIPLAISLSILIGGLCIINHTRQILVDVYNQYILRYYYIVLGILGPIHFYFSVDNIYMCVFGIVTVCISALMEIRYKKNGGDYTRWEL